MEYTVYHVYGRKRNHYGSSEVIAHSLSDDELRERILKKEVQLDIHEILPVTTGIASGEPNNLINLTVTT